MAISEMRHDILVRIWKASPWEDLPSDTLKLIAEYEFEHDVDPDYQYFSKKELEDMFVNVPDTDGKCKRCWMGPSAVTGNTACRDGQQGSCKVINGENTANLPDCHCTVE